MVFSRRQKQDCGNEMAKLRERFLRYSNVVGYFSKDLDKIAVSLNDDREEHERAIQAYEGWKIFEEGGGGFLGIIFQKCGVPRGTSRAASFYYLASIYFRSSIDRIMLLFKYA
ncbi:hypothetical protein ANTRET_LOCUS4957 [Anthophora retusa]